MNIELATAAAQIKVSDAKECAKLVEAALKRVRMSVVTMEGGNPQMVAMKQRMTAEMELLSAVLDSLKGNHVDLRVYSH
jgi:hypothetical protein